MGRALAGQFASFAPGPSRLSATTWPGASNSLKKENSNSCEPIKRPVNDRNLFLFLLSLSCNSQTNCEPEHGRGAN